jgi:RNA polymerase sigma factor (TIGR02999 family)
MSEITELLELCNRGDALARNRLFSKMYADLTRLASGHLARSRPLTLDPSAIVHEAWMRSATPSATHNRQQFFAYASAVMRSIIVDHVRERSALKRGGGAAPVTLATNLFEDLPQPEILDLDDGLKQLKEVDERAHDIVQMRFFGGMKLEEIADALGVSLPTVKRDLAAARAFLFKYFRH